MTLTRETLPPLIEELSHTKNGERRSLERDAFEFFISLLDGGYIRAAEWLDGEWKVNTWVKKGILLGFKLGALERVPNVAPMSFFEKDTLPLKDFRKSENVRIVPGGTSVRRGAYISPGVVLMPPSYVNIGAYIGTGTMIDSHALVGSCAQIGERIHISAAAQIGGVLEPIGALPVIIEDEVMVGGNCGIYDGTIVKKRAVLGAGVYLTSSMSLYDCVNERIISRSESGSLVVPENAVVIAGSRVLADEFGRAHGLARYAPLIIKYRDAQTDAKTALESALR